MEPTLESHENVHSVSPVPWLRASTVPVASLAYSVPNTSRAPSATGSCSGADDQRRPPSTVLRANTEPSRDDANTALLGATIGVARTSSNVGKLHRVSPLDKLNAYNEKSALPMNTVVSSRAGPYIAPAVLAEVQITAPRAVESEYTHVLEAPTTRTEPLGVSAGAASAFAGRAVRQSCPPVEPLNAYTFLSPCARNTMPEGDSTGAVSTVASMVTLHSSVPAPASSAYSFLSLEPMNTVPSIPSAAEVTMGPPVFTVHSTAPV